MKNKRIFSAILALALIIGLLPVSALRAEAAGSASAPKKETFKTSTNNIHTFFIYDIPAGQELDVTSVKSSKTSVGTIYSVSDTVYNKVDDYEPTGSAYISVRVKGFGTTSVSYKIGSKKYTTKVTFKKGSSSYTCAVDTFTVTGINSGKNLASKFKKKSYVDNLKLAKAQDDAKISVKAKSGWKVYSVLVYTYYEDGTHNLDFYSVNKKSFSIDELNLEKGKNISHSISVTFEKGDSYSNISLNFA